MSYEIRINTKTGQMMSSNYWWLKSREIFDSNAFVSASASEKIDLMKCVYSRFDKTLKETMSDVCEDIITSHLYEYRIPGAGASIYFDECISDENCNRVDNESILFEPNYKVYISIMNMNANTLELVEKLLSKFY